MFLLDCMRLRFFLKYIALHSLRKMF